MTTQRLNQQFGNYRLLSLLGQGGFSEVYLGEHVYLKTQAAIKILTMRLEQDELAHFLSEARIIAHLEHPHIVGVHDFGLEGEKPFLVLSYAPHGSMRQRYPRGSALPVAEIVTYARQISSALQYAHTQNLIHGDVKPENILIGRGEELLLSDFGVAVVASRSSPREDISGTRTIARGAVFRQRSIRAGRRGIRMAMRRSSFHRLVYGNRAATHAGRAAVIMRENAGAARRH